jgi:hypothetical protein
MQLNFRSLLKESLTPDFCYQVFFMNQFPCALEYPIGAISNFYKNSQRYPRLHV